MSAVPKPDQPILLREDRDGICTLTLNRPQQMNLLTGEMLAALQTAFDAIADDEQSASSILAADGQGLLRRPRPQGDPRAEGAAEDRGSCSRSAAA